DTRPALSGLAADVRAGQAETFPEKIDQQRPPFDVPAHGLTVHDHRHIGHAFTPGVSCPGRARPQQTNDPERSRLWPSESRATRASASWASESRARRAGPVRPEPR